MTRELYYPVLDCFMRALPFTYRDGRQRLERTCGSTSQENAAEAGISIATAIAGCRSRLPQGRQVSETTIPQDIAWRMFTKGIDREAASAGIVTGDRDLGSHILSMVSIIG